MQMDQKDIKRKRKETGLISEEFFNVHLPSVWTSCDSGSQL